MAATKSTRIDRTETTDGDVYIHGTAPASVLRATARGRRIRNAVSQVKRALQ